jgi:hypothetical protein
MGIVWCSRTLSSPSRTLSDLAQPRHSQTESASWTLSNLAWTLSGVQNLAQWLVSLSSLYIAPLL